MCSRVAFIKEGEIIKLEKMSTLQENSYKKISIEGFSGINKEVLEMSGVSKLEINGTEAAFIFKGNINTIMQRLAAIELRNISIEEPDLEEIFMHYYVKEE